MLCLDDLHHRNMQYDEKHGHTHNASALDTTQMTGTGSLDETQADIMDEMRPMAAVTTAPDSEHGTELNPSEAESYTVIIR